MVQLNMQRVGKTFGGLGNAGGQLTVDNPPTCISNKPAGSWPVLTALTSGSNGKAWSGGCGTEDWQNTFLNPTLAGTHTFKIDAGNVINGSFTATTTTLYFYGLKPTDINFLTPAAQLLGIMMVIENNKTIKNIVLK